MKRSRAEMFSYLGAPLKNVQWSWGSVRASDGAVFLVVWQDESMRVGSRSYSLVHNHSHWGETADSLGLKERLEHLDRIRGGAKAYLVMAQARQPRRPDEPRRIKDINSKEVFQAGGLLVDERNDVWLERETRMNIEQVRITTTDTER